MPGRTIFVLSVIKYPTFTVGISILAVVVLEDITIFPVLAVIIAISGHPLPPHRSIFGSVFRPPFYTSGVWKRRAQNTCQCLWRQLKTEEILFCRAYFKVFSIRHGPHGERAEREPITGVWGPSPQRGPGAEPLVRGSGGRSPPEAESFLAFQRPMKSAKLMKFTMIFPLSLDAEKLKFFTVSDKLSVCNVSYTTIECDSKFFPLKDWRIKAS